MNSSMLEHMDDAKRIDRLEEENATLRRELAVAKRAGEILADQVPDDCPLDYAPDCDRNKIVETIGCRDADCTHRPESCWITAATVRATAELEVENGKD